MKTVGTAAILAFAGLAASAWADTLVLWNGTRYDGRFVSGNRSTIRFDTGERNLRSFNIRDIQSLQFGADQTQSSGAFRSDSGYSRQNSQYTDSSSVRTLPAGTQLSVRTNETINSEAASSGRTYSAVIERDVTDSSGTVVIPRGSNAQMVIRDISTGGTFSGPELVLALQSVTINGRSYLVETSDVERTSGGLGANRRTATMVGGGAALGTLLGAIAGGGKGAVIGAIAGAAAGGTAQILTKGKEVRVPAETILTFQLEQPVALQPR